MFIVLFWECEKITRRQSLGVNHDNDFLANAHVKREQANVTTILSSCLISKDASRIDASTVRLHHTSTLYAYRWDTWLSGRILLEFDISRPSEQDIVDFPSVSGAPSPTP